MIHLTNDDAKQFESIIFLHNILYWTTSESSNAHSPNAADMFWLVVSAWNASVLFNTAGRNSIPEKLFTTNSSFLVIAGA